jgi:hypothetical protein
MSSFLHEFYCASEDGWNDGFYNGFLHYGCILYNKQKKPIDNNWQRNNSTKNHMVKQAI